MRRAPATTNGCYRRGVRRIAIAFLAASATVATVAAFAACSASEATSAGDFDGSPGPQDSGTADSATNDASAAAPDQLSVDAVVLVHAAQLPAFRVCFSGFEDDQPTPSAESMPESNVPGLETGGAVRFEARPGAFGEAKLFLEADIRAIYFGKKGPSCKDLLKLSIAPSAITVATSLPDMSRGVHLLVLRGCGKASADPLASVARCGETWTAATGNLALDEIKLDAYARRGGPTKLPLQIVQLSTELAAEAKQRELGIAFGPLDALDAGDGDAAAAFVYEGPIPEAKPVPSPPLELDYSGLAPSDYATSGVVVTLGRALADGGVVDAGSDAAVTRDVVLAQSLVDIQRRSAARSLPPDWFSAASSYVLLSVGELNAPLGDGGVDPQRSLHLLAVPLALPDAGADASARR